MKYSIMQVVLFPEIQKGYYYFGDRQIEDGGRHDDAHVRKQHSMNFAIARYGADTDTFYMGSLTAETCGNS